MENVESKLQRLANLEEKQRENRRLVSLILIVINAGSLYCVWQTLQNYANRGPRLFGKSHLEQSADQLNLTLVGLFLLVAFLTTLVLALSRYRRDFRESMNQSVAN